MTDNGKLVTKMFDLTSGIELKEAMVNLSGSLGPKDLGTIWAEAFKACQPYAG